MKFFEAMTFDNLYIALKKACRGIRWKESTIQYEANGLVNTHKLLHDVLNGTYNILPYSFFKIFEPKERDIVATRLRDRQFQHCLVDNVVYPKITEHFTANNAACQKGRGVDYALNRFTHYLVKYFKEFKTNYGWVLKLDIHHYFDSIDHTQIKDLVSKIFIDDPFTAKELHRIIDSYPGDKGLGLGSQVNQLLALAMLDDLDHYITEKLGIKYTIRYMDDMWLIHPSKSFLQLCRKLIDEYLAIKDLELNKKTTIQPLSQGITFLQWHISLKPSGKVLKRMSQSKVTKEIKRLDKLRDLELLGKVDLLATEQSFKSWIGNARRGDTFFERAKLASHYRSLYASYA